MEPGGPDTTIRSGSSDLAGLTWDPHCRGIFGVRDRRASGLWDDSLAQCRHPVRYGRRSGARFAAFSRPERKLRQMDSIFCTSLDLGTTAGRSEGYAVAWLRFFITTGEEPCSAHHPRCARAQNSTTTRSGVTVARAHKQSFKHNIISEWRIALRAHALLAQVWHLGCGDTAKPACKGRRSCALAVPCRSVEGICLRVRRDTRVRGAATSFRAAALLPF